MKQPYQHFAECRRQEELVIARRLCGLSPRAVEVAEICGLGLVGAAHPTRSNRWFLISYARATLDNATERQGVCLMIYRLQRRLEARVNGWRFTHGPGYKYQTNRKVAP